MLHTWLLVKFWSINQSIDQSVERPVHTIFNGWTSTTGQFFSLLSFQWPAQTPHTLKIDSMKQHIPLYKVPEALHGIHTRNIYVSHTLCNNNRLSQA